MGEKLEILLYPHEVLTTPAEPVKEIDDDIRKLVDDMIETMYDAPGIGLAAPQIGRSVRVCICDTANKDEGEEPQLYVMINPKVVESSGSIAWDEGCLSMPQLYREVKRPGKVTVEALDRDGKPYTVEAEGLLAVCMQHEIDHLDGVMFIDRLSRLKRRMALKEWVKIKRSLEGRDKKKKRSKGARA